MIRFRIGQSWKREADPSPVDSFGLDLDGVDLFSGASEEPLQRVVADLVEAVYALGVEGRPYAQLSLSEAHLEVCLRRRGTDTLLEVASLARPARMTRPPVSVDLRELVEAAVRCGKSLARDLTEAAPHLLRESRLRRMLKRLSVIERVPLAEEPTGHPGAGWGYQLFPRRSAEVGFELTDPDDLLLTYDPKRHDALPPLLAAGSVTLRLGEGDAGLLTLPGPPFLHALELSRQAAELSHGVESGEEDVPLPMPAPAPAMMVRPVRGEVELGGQVFPIDARALAGGMFELGLAVSFALAHRHKPLAKNPYVIELSERCREGLSHLRGGAARPTDERAAQGRKKKAGAKERPLRAGGRLRKLSFERQ